MGFELLVDILLHFCMLLWWLVQERGLDQVDASILVVISEVDDLPSNAIVARWVGGVLLP